MLLEIQQQWPLKQEEEQRYILYTFICIYKCRLLSNKSTIRANNISSGLDFFYYVNGNVIIRLQYIGHVLDDQQYLIGQTYYEQYNFDAF